MALEMIAERPQTETNEAEAHRIAIRSTLKSSAKILEAAARVDPITHAGSVAKLADKSSRQILKVLRMLCDRRLPGDMQ